MKKQITIRYEGNRQFSAPYAEDDLTGVKVGDEFGLKLKKDRELWRHRKFFAMLNTILTNLPEPIAELLPTLDNLIDDIKFGIGHTRPYINPRTGEVKVVPKSISFAEMDELKFTEFYNRALDFAIQNYFAGDDQMQAHLALSF